MDKIVLECHKKDMDFENLLKCLKSLFPECSLEIRKTDTEILNIKKSSICSRIQL